MYLVALRVYKVSHYIKPNLIFPCDFFVEVTHDARRILDTAEFCAIKF